MPEVTGTLEQLQGAHSSLVLRPRKMIVMVAPEGAAAVTSIVNTAGTALSFPDVYKPVGYLSKEAGLGLAPGMEKTESTAYGEAQPINQYISSTSFTAAFTMKETRRSVLEMAMAMDMSDITAAATTNEVVIDAPDQPEVRYPRLLIIGQHRDGADAIFVGHFLPRATLDAPDAQSWSDDSDLEYPVTYTALKDETLGTSRRFFLAGPGVTDDFLEAMDFPAGT